MLHFKVVNLVHWVSVLAVQSKAVSLLEVFANSTVLPSSSCSTSRLLSVLLEIHLSVLRVLLLLLNLLRDWLQKLRVVKGALSLHELLAICSKFAWLLPSRLLLLLLIRLLTWRLELLLELLRLLLELLLRLLALESWLLLETTWLLLLALHVGAWRMEERAVCSCASGRSVRESAWSL